MLPNIFLNNLSGRARAFVGAALTLAALLFYPAFAARAAAGDLDWSFGQDGITLPVSQNFTSASSIALQPDGKIVAGGRTGTGQGNAQFALFRYLADGKIDNNFGTNGSTVTSFTEFSAFNGYVNDVAVLPDGKIIAVGEIWVPNSFGFLYRINLMVVRYNPDGSLDTTFNGSGKFMYANGGFDVSAQAIAVQPDGKFLVAGYAGATIKGYVPYKSLLFRFSGNGLDATFSGGTVVTGNAGQIQSYSIALQADGKIVVGGRTYDNSNGGLSLIRYQPDGSLDTSFGAGGFVSVLGSNLNQAFDTLIQPDGKIIAVSSTYADNANIRDIAVLRFKTDGSPDPGFGTNGKVVTAITGISDDPLAGVLQANGKIIVAGYINDSLGSGAPYNLMMVRYNPNGSLDSTFGTGGIVRAPANFPLGDIVMQNADKILAVSNGFGNQSAAFRVLRFQLNGSRSFDFDGDRKADLSIVRPNAAAEWYWLDSSNGESRGLQFGNGTDKPVAADYDGDGKSDVAVFRGGDWYRLNSSDNSLVGVHFGQAGDKPVPADYDGDGKSDLAVYRQGDWYILNSADESFRAEHFGVATDKPIIGDFDGDGKNDLAVYRNGVWYVQQSRDGFFGAQFGISSDKPVAADFDGDGKTDLAVYRPADGTWYLLRSHFGFTAAQFGVATDKPVPADYDGDGRADIAVYRDGNWYLSRSQQGFIAAQFGTANDNPIPSAFVP